MNDNAPTVGAEGSRRNWKTAALALAGVWVLAAVCAYWLGGGDHARFLDLPLGAYLAGQGALVGAAALWFGVGGEEREDV